ncbi:hypothetical protein ACP70R_034295 [Stipagrostis hirtigluma subsp. patula]
MVRGLPFSSFFYTTNSAQDTPPPSPPPPTATPPPAWMWPSCKHPRTQSFRSPSVATKTIASLFLDSAESSSFANSSARTHHDCVSDSLSTESEASAAGAAADDMADAIVRGLRSDRLLFEPRAPSSSILEKKPPATHVRRRAAAGQASTSAPPQPPSFGDGVAVTFESADPYQDFRASMAEMVAAHGGAGDWDWLEKMLGWYLGANGRDTHPAIVAAFVDLVVSMAASTSAPSSSSRASSFTLAGSELESSS